MIRMVWSLTYSQILECEVKWALGSITMNKASGGDGIPVELFQILKDDAVESAALNMRYALNMQYACSRQLSLGEGKK